MRTGRSVLTFWAALAFVLGTVRPGNAVSELAWQLGPDDFVHYRIENLEHEDSGGSAPGHWGRIDDVAGFHGYELDKTRRRVTRDITHPELLYTPFVFSVPRRPTPGTRLNFGEILGGNWRLAPCRARGHVEVAARPAGADDGLTRLKGEVKFTWVAPANGATAYRRLLDGTLQWTSTFDPARGLVTAVEYELSWQTEEGTTVRPKGVHALSDRARTFRAKVRLTLDRVRTHRYPSFQRDVDAAIEEGVRFLEAMQEPDGSFRAGNPVGVTALALLAMLDGGRTEADASVKQGFDWLLRRRPWRASEVRNRTYTIGIAIMALERLRTPLAETKRRRQGLETDFMKRRLTGIERVWMQRCAGFLIETARIENRAAAEGPVTGPITEELWRWRYPREDRRVRAPVTGPRRRSNDWDNSNTQYAVLGLESAARCGIRIPDRAWYGIANHFLAVQVENGPDHKDLRIRYQQLREDAEPIRSGSKYAVPRQRARARGWAYTRPPAREPGTPPHEMTYGSMTTAGIASLAIARSRIARIKGRRRHRALLARIDQAILDGFASLEDMFSVWSNPRYEGWYTYYLYGLERAGMLAAVERFNKHDWYWEGAVQLLLRQATFRRHRLRHWCYDFGDVGTTAWAILFLKRGTPPVVTPR